MSYYYSYDRPSGYGRYSSLVTTSPYGTRTLTTTSSSYHHTPITSSYVISSRPSSTTYITPTPRLLAASIYANAPGIGKGRTYHRSIPVIAHQRLVPVSAPLYSVRPSSYYLDVDELTIPRAYRVRPATYIDDAFTTSIQDLEDEAREMRIQSSSLLHRLQAPSTFHTYQTRERSDYDKWDRESLMSYRPSSYAESLILQPIRDVHRNINNMSHYSDPVKKAELGRSSHLACISFAAGKPVSRRRPRFYDDDDKIRSEVLFRSHYERMPRRSASAGPAVCRSKESTAARRASAREKAIEKATQEMKARNPDVIRERLQKRGLVPEEPHESHDEAPQVRQPSPEPQPVAVDSAAVADSVPEAALEPEPQQPEPEPEPVQQPEPVVEEEKVEPVKEKKKKKKKDLIAEPIPEPEPEPVPEPQVEPEPELVSEPQAEPEPEPVQVQEIEPVGEPEPEPQPEAEPEPQVEVPETPEIQTSAETEIQPNTAQELESIPSIPEADVAGPETVERTEPAQIEESQSQLPEQESSPEDPTLVQNEVAEQIPEVTQEVEAPIAEETAITEVQVTESAEPAETLPEEESNPEALVNDTGVEEDAEDRVPETQEEFVDAQEEAAPVEPLNEDVSIWGDNEEDELFTKKRRPVVQEEPEEPAEPSQEPEEEPTQEPEEEAQEPATEEPEEPAAQEPEEPVAMETQPLEEFDWGDAEEVIVPRKKPQYVEETEE